MNVRPRSEWPLLNVWLACVVPVSCACHGHVSQLLDARHQLDSGLTPAGIDLVAAGVAAQTCSLLEVRVKEKGRGGRHRHDSRHGHDASEWSEQEDDSDDEYDDGDDDDDSSGDDQDVGGPSQGLAGVGQPLVPVNTSLVVPGILRTAMMAMGAGMEALQAHGSAGATTTSNRKRGRSSTLINGGSDSEGSSGEWETTSGEYGGGGGGCVGGDGGDGSDGSGGESSSGSGSEGSSSGDSGSWEEVVAGQDQDIDHLVRRQVIVSGVGSLCCGCVVVGGCVCVCAGSARCDQVRKAGHRHTDVG